MNRKRAREKKGKKDATTVLGKGSHLCQRYISCMHTHLKAASICQPDSFECVFLCARVSEHDCVAGARGSV